jgi:hypothetical protein
MAAGDADHNHIPAQPRLSHPRRDDHRSAPTIDRLGLSQSRGLVVRHGLLGGDLDFFVSGELCQVVA